MLSRRSLILGMPAIVAAASLMKINPLLTEVLDASNLTFGPLPPYDVSWLRVLHEYRKKQNVA